MPGQKDKKKMTEPKATSERITLKGEKKVRVVYVGARGGKYVKKDGKFIRMTEKRLAMKQMLNGGQGTPGMSSYIYDDTDSDDDDDNGPRFEIKTLKIKEFNPETIQNFYLYCNAKASYVCETFYDTSNGKHILKRYYHQILSAAKYLRTFGKNTIVLNVGLKEAIDAAVKKEIEIPLYENDKYYLDTDNKVFYLHESSESEKREKNLQKKSEGSGMKSHYDKYGNELYRTGF